jgi:type II secretory pathway component PulF
MASQIAPAADRVESGQGITQALRETGALTPVALDMVNTGEVTGSMEAVLENVATQYESEAEVRQEKMLRSMLIVWIALAAIFVLIIAASFYTGYFNSLMNQADG